MHCTKVQKINENKLFISSFLGEKSVFVAKLSKWQQKNNRQMVYYTPLDASISVFGNVTVWGSTGESTVNQLTVTLNRLKKLMVKRAKFTPTTCNLRSKQGTLQKIYSQKVLQFQKIYIPLQWQFPPRFPLAQRTRVGLLHFTIPSSTFLQMALGGIVIMQLFHTHKYCRWLDLSCRSNIHKFGLSNWACLKRPYTSTNARNEGSVLMSSFTSYNTLYPSSNSTKRI